MNWKFIAIFIFIRCAASRDATHVVCAKETAQTKWCDRKKNVREKRARRFAFSFHTWNSLADYFLSFLSINSVMFCCLFRVMLLCVSSIWNWRRQTGVRWGAAVIAAKDTWKSRQRWLAQSVCTHHWETLKRTFNNTARILCFIFVSFFFINPFGFAAQLHSINGCFYWLWPTTKLK